MFTCIFTGTHYFSNKIAHAYFLEDTFFQIKVTHDHSLVIPLAWCRFISRLFLEIFFESSDFSVVTNQFPHFNFEHFSCNIKIGISTSSFFTVQLNDFRSTTTTRKVRPSIRRRKRIRRVASAGASKGTVAV